MLQNIPNELRQLAQWVCAGPDKVPRNPRTGDFADVTAPDTWGTFDEACRAGMKHVGFVLSENDPYAAIDLDAPEDEDQEARHAQILKAAGSYSEVSQSGTGVHIFVKGAIPHGVRRDKVEVYSKERYMICTGDVLSALPIEEAQPLLDVLFKEMATTMEGELVDTAEIMPDEDVYEMGSRATNGTKFEMLWRGEWERDYPSQSEADLALMAMIAFYSKSNDQCRRLFRMSELGKRDKAQRDRYLNYMLSKARSHEPPTVDLKALHELADSILAKANETQAPDPRQGRIEVHTDTVRATDTATDGGEGDQIVPGRPALATIENPPGFVGELAEYFHSSAIRPVREIALASSLALVAGICGRSYNVSGTGLNQYLILLAKTGSGKEGIASGVDAVIGAVRASIPMADRFVGPASFASGQALVRVLDDRPCFVSVLGEFGVTLQQLCDPRAPAPTVMLKKVLLDLYNKSGHNKMLRPSVYSDTEKNTKMIQAPSITILGESTPDEFYDGLDASHVLGGLIPRFSIIEYTGPRPARNRNAFHLPGESIVTGLGDLITVALTTQQNHTCCPVQVDSHAQRLFDEFDEYADAQINNSNEIARHLWNRSHLKALKLGALLAVGCDPQQPVVTKELAEWALTFAHNDVLLISGKFMDGDVGVGQSKQENDIRHAVLEYMGMSTERRVQFSTPTKLLKEKNLIPYHYLRRRLRLISSFKNDRRGFAVALQTALDEAVKAENLVLIDQRTAREAFGVSQALYTMGPTF